MIDKMAEIAKREIAKPEMILGGPGLAEEFQAHRVVRAILTAMLKPTEAMLEFGDVVVDNWEYGHTVATSELADAYRAMIQAALDEKEG